MEAKSNIVNTPTIETTLQSNTGTFLQILFLEGRRKEICVGSVAGGSRVCLYLRHKCSTASHACLKEEGEDPPGGKYGVWVVMAAPAPKLPLSAFFQPILSGKTAEMVQRFQGLPM